MDALDTATNAQLDEFFSLELAGWTKTIVFGNEIRPWKGPESDELFAEPPEFDADDILPFLEKQSPWRVDCGASYGYMIQIWRGPDAEGRCYEVVTSPTFTRAAKIALIRAKRASK